MRCQDRKIEADGGLSSRRYRIRTESLSHQGDIDTVLFEGSQLTAIHAQRRSCMQQASRTLAQGISISQKHGMAGALLPWSETIESKT